MKQHICMSFLFLNISTIFHAADFVSENTKGLALARKIMQNPAALFNLERNRKQAFGSKYIEPLRTSPIQDQRDKCKPYQPVYYPRIEPLKVYGKK